MKVWTAQYRYNGQDRLDITVKGNDPIGRIFAPTWHIVNGYKNGKLTKIEYTIAYMDILRTSAQRNKETLEEVRNKDEVTFVCFCKPKSFCHRKILAMFFVRFFGAKYMGERNV